MPFKEHSPPFVGSLLIPFVVSLTNHASIDHSSFDKLRTNEMLLADIPVQTGIQKQGNGWLHPSPFQGYRMHIYQC